MRHCGPKLDFRKRPARGFFRSIALIMMLLQFIAFPLCARQCGSEIRARIAVLGRNQEIKPILSGHGPGALSVTVAVAVAVH